MVSHHSNVVLENDLYSNLYSNDLSSHHIQLQLTL